MQTLIEIIKEQIEYMEDLEYRDNYSGRGMYGKRCVAVSGSEDELRGLISNICLTLAQEIYEAAMDGTEEYAHDLNNKYQEYMEKILRFESDSMGRDTIYYWREIQDDSQELDDEE